MASAFTTRRIAGVGAGAFVFILSLGVLAAAGAFVWTIEGTDHAAFVSQTGRGARDPDPAFSQKVRQMYLLGGDRAVIEACRARRDSWPHDPEALIYAAFAYERLAEQPGLEAFHAGLRADQLWEGLYRKASDPNRGFIGSRTYMEAWALMGMGRPLLSTETFGRYVDQIEWSLQGMSSYNRACYLAMAGDTDGATRAFARAAQRQRNLQRGWPAADPDLEAIHGTFEFSVWNTYYELRNAGEWRRLRSRQERNRNGPILLESE